MTNDGEMENIDVDEPIIQKVRTVRTYVKQEMADDPFDPLYTEDYLDASPKRKSPTKKQPSSQNGKFIFEIVLHFEICENRIEC